MEIKKKTRRTVSTTANSLIYDVYYTLNKRISMASMAIETSRLLVTGFVFILFEVVARF